MKKQRPHKGSKAAKRARKARASANAANLALASSPPTPSKHARPPDPWAWHSDTHKGAPGRRAKGPPPRRQKSKPAIAKPAPSDTRRRSSKLAPALAAELRQPVAPPQPALSPSQWMRTALTSRWREDRVAAAVLLAPTLLIAAALMLSPRQRAPIDQSPLVAVWRGASPTAPAVTETAAIAGRYAPPFARPAERTMAHVPTARHDLDAITPALTKDANWAVAMAGAPFSRPPERPMSLIPTARHDLDAVTPALGNDARQAVAMAGPPFVRPAEGSVPSVPMAAHDLSAVVAALARDVDASRSRPATQPEPADDARTAYSRPAEGTLLSGLPEVPASSERADVTVCRPGPTWQARLLASRTEPLSEILADPEKFGLALAHAAKAQIADLVVYNAKYMTIAYPGGDVPELFGVCTDVIIRAYRTLGIDLQDLVHRSRPRGSDPSIDHRRTELLRAFFATHGEQLAISPYIEDYLPGDIVTYYRPQNKSSQSHIAVVTDVIAPSGRPMIAHNRGWGVQLEDALFVDQMTGHYRYRGPQAADALVASNKATAAQTASVQRAKPPATQSAAEQGAVPPPEARKGLGRQTAVQPTTTVQMANAKAPIAGAQRMGLGMGPPPAEAADRCSAPSLARKGDRICATP